MAWNAEYSSTDPVVQFGGLIFRTGYNLLHFCVCSLGTLALTLLVEYETARSNVIPVQFQLQESDAACALCLVPAAYTLMIPGAVTSCPPGFHQEYFGWLMATHYTQAHPTEYSCVAAYLDRTRHTARASGTSS
jgi:hypothetical protein